MLTNLDHLTLNCVISINVSLDNFVDTFTSAYNVYTQIKLVLMFAHFSISATV